MRAPAFQWYAAEYLADERVAQLSLESEAVYVRLLSYCWREGTIPANPAQCAPLCKYADVKVIKPALSLFMKAPGQSGRLIHKRLEEERDKQQAFKDKQVINGKLGGRPRKPNDNPDESQTKGLGYSGLTQTEPKKRSSTSSSISSVNTTDVVAAAPEPLKAKSKAEIVSAQVAADGGATFTADTFTALNDPKTFADSLAYLGYTGIDFERYRLDIRGKVKAAGLDVPATALGKFIVSYMTRESAAGPLLPAPVAARVAGVMPDDPCSLWGVPNPDYDHRTYNQPAGQYSGTIQ